MPSSQAVCALLHTHTAGGSEAHACVCWTRRPCSCRRLRGQWQQPSAAALQFGFVVAYRAPAQYSGHQPNMGGAPLHCDVFCGQPVHPASHTIHSSAAPPLVLLPVRGKPATRAPSSSTLMGCMRASWCGGWSARWRAAAACAFCLAALGQRCFCRMQRFCPYDLFVGHLSHAI